MTPREYVKAVGLPTVNVVWCAFWLVFDATHDHGWVRWTTALLFAALLGLAVYQWPRSLAAHRRMLASRDRLDLTLANLRDSMLANGWPPEAAAEVIEMLDPGPPRLWHLPRPPRLPR